MSLKNTFILSHFDDALKKKHLCIVFFRPSQDMWRLPERRCSQERRSTSLRCSCWSNVSCNLIYHIKSLVIEWTIYSRVQPVQGDNVKYTRIRAKKWLKKKNITPAPTPVSVCINAFFWCHGYEGSCRAPRGSEEPLQHSHHGWWQRCHARRQQGLGEDEGLLSRE